MKLRGRPEVPNQAPRAHNLFASAAPTHRPFTVPSNDCWTSCSRGTNYDLSVTTLPLPTLTTMHSMSIIPKSTPAEAIPRIGSRVDPDTMPP